MSHTRASVYNRYNRWGERSVWKGIFDALAEECEDSLTFIDASIVKAHRAASGSSSNRSFGRELAEGNGRSRGARTSKIRAAVDAKGRPLRNEIPTKAALAVISSKGNSRNPVPQNTILHTMRNIVEQFVCRTKNMRRQVTRFERLGRTFLSMIDLSAIRCCLK